VFDPAETLASLPHRPGVYRMLDAAGEVLYVGKALDLRKRVSSYFRAGAVHSPRIAVMVGHVAAVETTVTRSEAEALLLENNFIKSLAPRYNILYRDDKSYPFMMLTGHDFPRLGFHRGVLERQHRYFGPFPNAGAVRDSIQLLQRVFRLRTCQDAVFNNRSRPCLLHQIHRCTAPCVGLIDKTAYARDVADATLFLEGKEDEVLQNLTTRMELSAERFEYEQAALLRDQIQTLRKVREKQFVDRGEGESVDTDVVACVSASGMLVVNLVVIRGGRHIGDKSFFPQNADPEDLTGALEAFLTQHYLERPVPARVIVNQPLDVSALAELLSAQAHRRVEITHNVRSERRIWVEMAEQNARLAAEQKLAQQATQETRLRALQAALELDTIARIECFDISHTMGEATVASCVVYESGQMRKSEYRRFNIATAEAGDDYAAMREVLQRRYRRLVAGEGRLPELVLIDGGKGQLGVACEVFSELDLSEVQLVGVAKGEERKPGLEQLWLPGLEHPLELAPNHPGLHLIQQIRDEAHRFAIQGHRARRGKTRTGSVLDAVEGIGAKRRQRLLTRFGGLKGLLAASIDDLAQVEGVSRTLAQRIYQQLH
jgi:excinuclease ABC subunit C